MWEGELIKGHLAGKIAQQEFNPSFFLLFLVKYKREEINLGKGIKQEGNQGMMIWKNSHPFFKTSLI